MSDNFMALPGKVLSSTTSQAAGSGTHVQDDSIRASILGQPVSTKSSKNPQQAAKTSHPKLSSVMSVLRPSASSQRAPMLPTVGAQVYAKVVAVQRQQALCEIRVICPSSPAASPSLEAGSSSDSDASDTSSMHALVTPFRGILRAQDVRATEKDKIKLSECFKVGDIIRAVVISLGDQGGYYLSTAGNEYGVILAWSQGAGNLCVPISWCEVVDSVTGVKELRKVAKPI